VVGIVPSSKTTITGVEMFKKSLNEVGPGKALLAPHEIMINSSDEGLNEARDEVTDIIYQAVQRGAGGRQLRAVAALVEARPGAARPGAVYGAAAPTPA
jgi:hypothetical protein